MATLESNLDYRGARALRLGIERLIHRSDPRPVLDPMEFTWAREIEALHPHIKKEAANVLKKIEQITNFQDVVPGQRAIKQGNQWKSFFLKALGRDVKAHQSICPVTTAALRKIPGLVNAFFSILGAGTHIPAHRGPYAGLLRYHLGVIIPEGDTAIRVEKQICQWREGQSLFFDDSFDHEAWNYTDSTRVILFVDLMRPLPPLVALANRAVFQAFRFSEIARKAQAHVLANQISMEAQ